MPSRRVSGRAKRLTLEDREHETALRARTALSQQTKGDFPVYGEARAVPARHNPFAGLSNAGLRAVEALGLTAILGVGFGYLVPHFSWPPEPAHVGALVGILAACASAVLASQRLSENRLRLLSAALHWKIGDTGVFVSESDAKAQTIEIRFLPWSDVAVAESHRGRVVLLDAKGAVLADLHAPSEAQDILQVIHSQRARRGEGNPGDLRGPRIEPRLDYPEHLDRTGLPGDYPFDGPVDLDVIRHATLRRDGRREPWIEAPRSIEAIASIPAATEGNDTEVLDAEFIDVVAETPDAPSTPVAESSSAADDTLETVALDPESTATAAAPDAEPEPGSEASADPVAHPILESTAAVAAEIEPAIDDGLAREIDDSIRNLFDPVDAAVVPQSVVDDRETLTRPVPVDTSRALPSNDDPVARREDTVMRRLMEQLAVPDAALGPLESRVDQSREFRRRVEEAAANQAEEPPVSRVA